MGMTDYRRIPVRLSYGNPEHVKIMDILDDLNLDVHKSRNQFIINAILFYVDAIKNDTLTYAEERRQKEMEERFVTQDEMQKFSDKVKTELYEEMIKFLAGTFMTSGAGRALPYANVPAGNYTAGQTDTDIRGESKGTANDDVAETLSQYDNVMQQVMNWSEDD